MNVKKNILYMYIIYTLNILFPLITVPLITNSLLIDEYGKYSLAYSVFSLCLIFTDYSFNSTSIREYANAKTIYRRNYIYCLTQSIKYKIALLSSALSTIYIHYMFSSTKLSLLYFIATYLGLIGYSLYSTWHYQATNTLKNNTLLIILMKCTSLIIIYLCVKYTLTKWIYIYIASTMIYLPFGFLAKYKPDKNYKTKIKTQLRKLKYGFGLFTAEFSPNLYNLIPVIIVADFITHDRYATFSLANRLNLIICGFFYVFLKACYPYFCKKNNINHYKLIFFSFLFSTMGYIIYLVIGKEIIGFLFGSEYLDSFYYLKYIFIGIIFISISEPIQYIYLLPNNKDRLITITSICVVVISLCFLLIFFNTYHEWAVIVAVILARFLYSLVYTTHLIKELIKK
ncbi:oligosaccharide flippase family protein [Morganella psychrotolerans]